MVIQHYKTTSCHLYQKINTRACDADFDWKSEISEIDFDDMRRSSDHNDQYLYDQDQYYLHHLAHNDHHLDHHGHHLGHHDDQLDHHGHLLAHHGHHLDHHGDNHGVNNQAN